MTNDGGFQIYGDWNISVRKLERREQNLPIDRRNRSLHFQTIEMYFESWNHQLLPSRVDLLFSVWALRVEAFQLLCLCCTVHNHLVPLRWRYLTWFLNLPKVFRELLRNSSVHHHLKDGVVNCTFQGFPRICQQYVSEAGLLMHSWFTDCEAAFVLLGLDLRPLIYTISIQS